MLGVKNKDNPFYHGGTTLLAKSIEVVGDIKFSGTLEVEGKVTGNIYAVAGESAQVNVRASGEVIGEVSAPRVMINGHVTGDVHAQDHLELAAKSIVNGNVHYQVIEMVKGAELNGGLVHITPDVGGSAESLRKAEPQSDSSGSDQSAVKKNNKLEKSAAAPSS